MRNYRRYARAAQRGRSGNQDFWLSFSDLMSVLVLVFILVLFYILYQYFLISDAYQVKLDEMLVIEAALSEKETELATQKTELESAQIGLTEAQEELAHQQLMLNLAQQSLEDSETVLADKQADWNKLGLWAGRLQLTTENSMECVQIMERYLGRGNSEPNEITRGLYYRTVE